MFKKDKTDEAPPVEAPKKQEETAYEDSWYRSLKAMAERTPEGDEEVGAPED